MIRRRSFLKAAAATTALLSAPSVLCAYAKEPATVYTGGPIFTMNKNNDIVEAIAIRGDTILAVGKKADVLAAAKAHGVPFETVWRHAVAACESEA